MICIWQYRVSVVYVVESTSRKNDQKDGFLYGRQNTGAIPFVFVQTFVPFDDSRLMQEAISGHGEVEIPADEYVAFSFIWEGRCRVDVWKLTISHTEDGHARFRLFRCGRCGDRIEVPEAS